MADIYAVYFSVCGEPSHAHFERAPSAVRLARTLDGAGIDAAVVDMERDVLWASEGWDD